MKHLEDVGMTYWEHFERAITNSAKLAFASWALLVHAWFPFIFTKTASSIVTEVNDEFSHHKEFKHKGSGV